MGTLACILLILGAVLPYIGALIILIGGRLFKNGTCLKIGDSLLLISIFCLFGSAIADGIDGKKTTPSETGITDEKIIKVVETKKEPVIDTTIVIKNGIADTTFIYNFKK